MEIKIEEINIDHEFEQLLPPLTKEEYKNLENSILKYGMRDSIKLWEDQDSKIYIVDGHNRYNICNKNSINIEPYQLSFLDPTLFLSKSDVMRWMLDTQLGRRNLTPMQRFAIAQKYKSLYEEKAKQNLSDGGKGLTNLSKVNTRKEMAKTVGVSEGTYAKMDKIYHSSNEELKTKVQANEISIDKAFKSINNDSTEHKAAEFVSTDDCDKAIAELELKEKALQDQKERFYLIRQRLYDESSDDDIRCEAEEEKDGSIPNWFYNCWATYNFYLIKKNNRRLIIDFASCILESLEEINDWIKIIDSWEFHKKITPQEKKVLISKIYEVHKLVLEKKAAYEKYQQDIYNRKSNQTNRQIALNSIKISSEIRELINAGYRTLAKKYHPDTLNGDGQKMQLINDAKNTLDALIQLAEHQAAS